jgi:hypothetical protein
LHRNNDSDYVSTFCREHLPLSSRPQSISAGVGQLIPMTIEQTTLTPTDRTTLYIAAHTATDALFHACHPLAAAHIAVLQHKADSHYVLDPDSPELWLDPDRPWGVSFDLHNHATRLCQADVPSLPAIAFAIAPFSEFRLALPCLRPIPAPLR